jgi:hypothetical protein
MGNRNQGDPYLEMQREEIAKRQIDTDVLGKEWVHDPTPQSPNRWVNTDTGEYRYQEQKPGEGGGGDDGSDRTDDEHPLGSGEEADAGGESGDGGDNLGLEDADAEDVHTAMQWAVEQNSDDLHRDATQAVENFANNISDRDMGVEEAVRQGIEDAIGTPEDPENVETTPEDLAEDVAEIYEEEFGDGGGGGDNLGQLGENYVPDSEFGQDAANQIIDEHGDAGVQYVEEALHQNGDYFQDLFDSLDEVMDDAATYVEHTD